MVGFSNHWYQIYPYKILLLFHPVTWFYHYLLVIQKTCSSDLRGSPGICGSWCFFNQKNSMKHDLGVLIFFPLFLWQVSNEDIDEATRLAWKYACTRGVYGTPMFTVNDVFVQAQADWTLEQWIDLIKPLLS